MGHTLKDGYEVAKKIEREWFYGVNQRFNEKSDKYHQLRKYARGEHSVEDSKSYITNSEVESYTNYDFSPVQVLPKFKDKIINDMLPQLYNIEANAVDKYSTDLKNEERERLMRRMVSKNLDEDMKQLFGVDIDGMHDDDRPESEEEIDLRMSMNFKPNIEIAVEESLKYTFELNDYDETLFELLNDAIDLGRIATQTSLHPKKGIVTERIDPSEMVWSFVKNRNHSDAWYYGVRKRITIGDLQIMTDGIDVIGEQIIFQKFDEDLLKQIKGSVDDSIRTQTNENAGDPGGMDRSEKLDILYYTYKTVIDSHMKKKEYKSGATKITPFKGDYDGRETKGFTVITQKDEVWYEGHLILGTNYAFGHRLVDNLAYKKTSGISRVYPPINMYATALYDGEAKGMIARCDTLIDKIQTTEIKIQQLVAQARPSGIRMDISKINNIPIPGGTMDYKVAMKIYNDTGIEIYSSGDGEENEYSQGNIHELQNGVVRGILDLVNIQNNYLTQLRDAIGLPQGADASLPHPDTAVRIQEQIQRNSNVTLRHVLDSVLKLTRYTSDNVFVRIKDVFKYYPHIRKSYISAIGKVNIDLIKSLKNIEKHDIGIFVSLKPSARAMTQLENNIALSITAQTINLDDAQEVRDVGKTSTKMANQLLRIRREKQERKTFERENKKIELQGQQQQQTAQVQGQVQQESLQVQLTIDQSRIQSEAEAKIAVEREKSKLKSKEMQEKFNYDSQLENIKGQYMTSKTVYSENQKTERELQKNKEK